MGLSGHSNRVSGQSLSPRIFILKIRACPIEVLEVKRQRHRG